MAKYVCAFCGKSSSMAHSVTSGKCSRSPNGAHKVISEQDQYVCKYCAKKSKLALSVLNGSCSKSPNKRHELMG